jgi:hypothetical protein
MKQKSSLTDLIEKIIYFLHANPKTRDKEKIDDRQKLALEIFSSIR